jgi:hypothetical protein
VSNSVCISVCVVCTGEVYCEHMCIETGVYLKVYTITSFVSRTVAQKHVRELLYKLAGSSIDAFVAGFGPIYYWLYSERRLGV